jgi:CheY-like chemotaxis protein
MPSAATASPEPSLRIKPLAPFPLHILLAEDNPVNQKVALHLLARIDYRAVTAANGLEALAALRRQPYDVVLMDMQMPEMDGLEATRQIRADKLAAQPWIIALTANAAPEDREACVRAGMNDYLSKPLVSERLAEILDRLQTERAAASRPLPSRAVHISVKGAGPNERVSL